MPLIKSTSMRRKAQSRPPISARLPPLPVAAQYNSGFGSPSNVVVKPLHAPESNPPAAAPKCFRRCRCLHACSGAGRRPPRKRASRAHHQRRKSMTTSAGGRYRWVFVKIVTSEPGLYGIGSANNNYQTAAVIAALESHLKPWLIGKDPDRIEDLWQAAQMRTYWRNGPVNNNVLAAMDMALWDIKGKRAGMPVYDMLGGKAHDAIAVYDHQGGATKEVCLESLRKSMANGFRHVRIQFGE